MENINADFTKLATTASVLVNSATGNSNINNMLQKNKTFTSTFESSHRHSTQQHPSNNIVHYSKNGLIGLLAKHGDDIRVVHSLRRSNFDGKKKKNFNILSNEMLNEIIESTEMQSRTDSGNSESTTKIGNLDEDPSFSLFQGFTALLPEVDETIQNIKTASGKMITDKKKSKINGKNMKNNLPKSRFQKIEEITSDKIKSCQNQRILLNYKSDINYHLDLMEIRKGLGKREIAEIDAKIDRLYNLRKEIYDNVTFYEKTEIKLENQLLEIQDRLEFIKDIERDETGHDLCDLTDENGNVTANETNDINKSKNNIKQKKIRGNTNDSNLVNGSSNTTTKGGDDEYDDDYVTVYLEEDSRSYSRVTSSTRNLKSGDQIHKFQAHNESINCIAFDEPYGKLLTCSVDNTVRVWDMNRYKCIGLLEGHNSYVECVTVSQNLAFTGGMDASVKMWDLDHFSKTYDEIDEGENMTPLLKSFDGHVDAITALSYSNGELVSGADDKTIRQWDLSSGHLVQTIDVMWASSMANSMINFGNTPMGAGVATSSTVLNSTSSRYPYLSCLQVFDAALASGSSDGIVRLWDLRSGDIIRQLFGHTGAVTTLEFDSSFNLITGSADRSVRIWDLRTGGILDSFSYDNPIKKIMFDELKIASVVENERGIHIYDRTEQRHWMLGGDVLPEGSEDSPTSNAYGNNYVSDMQFSRSYLVEGRSDGVVGVWNV